MSLTKNQIALLQIGITVFLLACPRIFPSVNYPSWWAVAAFLGPWIVFSRMRSSPTSGAAPLANEWRAFGDTLGLEYRRPGKHVPQRLRGTIDGHRISVSLPPGRPAHISVDFESGLRNLSLYRRSANSRVVTNREEVATGDPAFDERYRLFADQFIPNEQLLSYLNAQRRSVILSLDDAFDVDEIEEDELEVRLHNADASEAELRKAIEVCVRAAQALDQSAAPVADSPGGHRESAVSDAVNPDREVFPANGALPDDDAPPVFGRTLS